jgi:hypothetical protein
MRMRDEIDAAAVFMIEMAQHEHEPYAYYRRTVASVGTWGNA